MKRSTIIIGLVVASLIGLAVNKLAKNKAIINKETSYHEVSENVPVNVQTASTSNISTELNFVGSFVASKEAPISAEMGGKITRVFVKEGDYIAEGQTIAELDHALLAIKLEADVAQYQHSKEDLVRYENLSKSDATTDVALKQIRLTNALNEIAVRNTKEQIAKSKIKAPISGYLTAKSFETGMVVSPGISIGHVATISTLKFTTMVPEYQMVKLAMNQRVNVGADVFNNTKFVGLISQIAKIGDANHNYKIEVTIHNNNNQFPLKAGMSGTMHVNDKNTTTGIFISRDVLQGTMAKPQVYLVKNNRAILKDVAIGISVGNNIQILDGIQDGDKIVSTGMNSLKDSTTIKIVEANIAIN